MRSYIAFTLTRDIVERGDGNCYTESMNGIRKLPIDVQSFEKLRTGGYLYVDKTDLVYKLAAEGSQYFLSRPRRFGKSLLTRTLQAYFEGRKTLFKGLAIEKKTGNGVEEVSGPLSGFCGF